MTVDPGHLPRSAHCRLHVGGSWHVTLSGIVRVPPDNPALPAFSIFRVEDSPCPWFPGMVMRIERSEVPPISPEIGQALVDHGWWRRGTEIRRRTCPDCTACHELRVDAQSFRPSRAQVRTRNRAQAHLVASWERPGKTEERWALIQRHAMVRFDEQAGSLEMRAIHGYGDSASTSLSSRSSGPTTRAVSRMAVPWNCGSSWTIACRATSAV